MPEKPTLSQVGLLGTWSNEHFRPCVRIPAVFKLKVVMNINSRADRQGGA